MKPEITYELQIKLKENNQDLLLDIKEQLHFLNIFAYCEGSIDNLDLIENEETDKKREELLDPNFFTNLLILNGYEESQLLKVKKKLEEVFSTRIEIEISSFDTASWLEAWKDSFKPIYTDTFVVCPPWDRKEQDGKTQIIIEPALAFGTGQHETTQLCLSLLENFLKSKKPQTFVTLDLGTGSGILAIAAAKNKVTTLDALDIDEDSVAAAQTNASLNLVSFDVYKSDLTSFIDSGKAKTYDLILANILLPVLRKDVPLMATITKTGSELILSGLILEQEEEMLEITEECGFELVERMEKGEWLGLRVRKS